MILYQLECFRDSHVAIAIGCSVGGVVLLAVAVVCALKFVRCNKKSDDDVLSLIDGEEEFSQPSGNSN